MINPRPFFLILFLVTFIELFCQTPSYRVLGEKTIEDPELKVRGEFIHLPDTSLFFGYKASKWLASAGGGITPVESLWLGGINEHYEITWEKYFEDLIAFNYLFLTPEGNYFVHSNSGHHIILDTSGDILISRDFSNGGFGGRIRPSFTPNQIKIFHQDSLTVIDSSGNFVYHEKFPGYEMRRWNAIPYEEFWIMLRSESTSGSNCQYNTMVHFLSLDKTLISGDTIQGILYDPFFSANDTSFEILTQACEKRSFPKARSYYDLTLQTFSTSSGELLNSTLLLEETYENIEPEKSGNWIVFGLDYQSVVRFDAKWKLLNSEDVNPGFVLDHPKNVDIEDGYLQLGFFLKHGNVHLGIAKRDHNYRVIWTLEQSVYPLESPPPSWEPVMTETISGDAWIIGINDFNYTILFEVSKGGEMVRMVRLQDFIVLGGIVQRSENRVIIESNSDWKMRALELELLGSDSFTPLSLSPKSEILVYPNPIKSNAFIRAGINDLIEISSLNGQIVYQQVISTHQASKRFQVDLGHLRQGMYIIKVHNKEHTSSQLIRIID